MTALFPLNQSFKEMRAALEIVASFPPRTVKEVHLQRSSFSSVFQIKTKPKCCDRADPRIISQMESAFALFEIRGIQTDKTLRKKRTTSYFCLQKIQTQHSLFFFQGEWFNSYFKTELSHI